LFLLVLAGLLLPSPAVAEVYKYVNKDGVVSYTDSLQAVPEKYRKTATVVKDLREKEEKPAGQVTGGTASGTRKQEPQPQASTPVKEQLEQRVHDIREKGYWKPVVVILGLIAVFFLMGKASDVLGHKGLWTVLRIFVVLGLMGYFLYAYTNEMAGVYNTLREQVDSLKSKVDKRQTDENRTQNEMFQDTKKQGERK
jgi:hypothetical protein